MPTYDYHCKHCGHELELFQQMTESPKKICPKCKAPKLIRRIGGGGGLIFKGPGFYATDYRKGTPPKDAKAPPSTTPSTSSPPAKPSASDAVT